MPRSAINFDTVRKIGLTLPGVEESTSYGSPALKVRGKLLACVPAHRSAERGSLAVRVGFDDRAELLAAAPDVYYLTDHYLNYSAVLVRLSRVTPDVLRDLLGMAHKFVTADATRRSHRAADASLFDFIEALNDEVSGRKRQEKSMSQDNGGGVIGKCATVGELLNIRQYRLCRRARLLECLFKTRNPKFLALAVGRLQNAVRVHQDPIS